MKKLRIYMWERDFSVNSIKTGDKTLKNLCF